MELRKGDKLVNISVLTTEYIRVRVEAEDSGVPVDPTSNPPEFALLDFDTDPDPVGGDWSNGTWETVVSGSETQYYARIIVGTGGIVLVVGKYNVWLKVTHSPEIPVRKVGALDVM